MSNPASKEDVMGLLEGPSGQHGRPGGGRVGSALGGLGRLGALVILRVHRLLEVLDALADRLAEVRQLPGAEDDDNDEQDQDQFGRSDRAKHGSLLGYRPKFTPRRYPRPPEKSISGPPGGLIK